MLSDADSGTGPLEYESIGYASIELSVTADGVALVANADGLMSLSDLLRRMAERADAACHIHLSATLQLVPTSAPFVVARREGGLLADGSQTST